MFTLILLPFFTGLICLFAPKTKFIGYISLLGSVLLALFTVSKLNAIFHNQFLQESFFYLDIFSAYMLSIIVFLSLLATAYSIEYLKHELDAGLIDYKYMGRFYFLLNVFISSMILVVSTDNLAIIWIAIEATTIVSTPLIGLGFTKRELAIEAAWKYIILCSVGITFALLGTFIAYYASTAISESGSLSFVKLKENANLLNPTTMKLAFIFILVGYGTKAGLAPLHSWLPDAHSQAPTPVSALLSGILLNTALYGVLRFLPIVQTSSGAAFTNNLFLIFGVISIGISAILIIVQHNFKRILAYSSIEHMGIISFGIGVGGVLATYGALLHILNHAIAKPFMFFLSGKIQSRFGSTNIDRISNVISKMPLLGILSLIGVLALSGTPPLNVFVSEFTIMKAATEKGLWLPFGLFLFFVIFIFYGLLSSFGKMLFKRVCENEIEIEIETKKGVRLEEFLTYAVLVLLALLVVILGVSLPQPIDFMVKNSVAILGVR